MKVSKELEFPEESKLEFYGHHQYVSLKEQKVYDVEIIVFAYLNEPLPNYKTYTNKPIFDDSQALTLLPKPAEFDWVRQPKNLVIEEQTQDKTERQGTGKPLKTDKYTVNIENDEDELQVLAWFEHDVSEFKLEALWQRLEKNTEIKPLIHKAWRLAETPFDNPTFVKLNNSPTLDEGSDLEAVDLVAAEVTSFAERQELREEEKSSDAILEQFNGMKISPDFSIQGMVALSQGRFMHFGHQLNLMRVYNDNPEGFAEDAVMKNMIFSLQERRQLKTDELNYYDSPWFGSIVKITEYNGEQNEEE